MASPAELSDFLKRVEKRAFKRTVYQVRDDEAALDIVQDSMMKLAEHYGHKPADELPLLFQRILSNSTLDWFRRQKVHNAIFLASGELAAGSDEDEGDPLEWLADARSDDDNPETWQQRAQTLGVIEEELLQLPARQREAFLLRYWEELDVAETATVMGCSDGSVKTHCSRAVQALHKALKARGVTP